MTLYPSPSQGLVSNQHPRVRFDVAILDTEGWVLWVGDFAARSRVALVFAALAWGQQNAKMPTWAC